MRLVTLLALGVLAQASDLPVTPVADLGRKPELVQRELVVEGRKPNFSADRSLRWSSFTVEGSKVEFRLPPALSLTRRPSEAGIRVRGVLQPVGAGFVFNVTHPPELLSSDLERLEKGVAALPPTDFRHRQDWADWAERRAAEYKDEPLQTRARQLASEALRLEAAHPSMSAPGPLLDLVEQARARKAAEPEPTALAHEALRSLLSRVRDPEEAEALATRAAKLLPPHAGQPQDVDLGDWLAASDRDPADAYRRADPAVRPGLDRRLLADLIQRSLELKASSAPDRALGLAARAEKELPDRPRVASTLRLQALESTDVKSLRLSEVQERAKLYEQLNEPRRARELLGAWLDEQRRSRLSPNDADGRVDLAAQYETLIQDHVTAEALLREAWRLDPGAESTTEAFRRRGYRHVNGEWVAPTGSTHPAGESSTATAAPKSSRSGADPYRGLNRAQVLEKLGKPDTISRVATQGQLREQWIYRQQGKSTIYLNLVQRNGTTTATVTSWAEGR